MVGERYGKLVVIEEYITTLDNGTRRRRVSKCKCDCGNFITVRTDNLKSGNTKSCGCSRQKAIKNMIGKRFGMLTIISEGIHDDGVTWNCICDCGRIVKNIRGRSLRSGHTKSCGHHRVAHKYNNGDYNNCYHVWWGMIQRCENTKSISYSRYGARGITVCERWHDFNSFMSDMGKRPDKSYELDRIDNDKSYCKENCRWVTRTENARNRRNNVYVTYKGKRYLLMDFPHKNTKFLKNHRYDGTLLIEGGKYDNKEWYLNHEIARVKKERTKKCKDDN